MISDDEEPIHGRKFEREGYLAGNYQAKKELWAADYRDQTRERNNNQNKLE